MCAYTLLNTYLRLHLCAVAVAWQLMVLCKSQEFSDIQLRTNEKRALNTLNKDKNRATIRSAFCIIALFSSIRYDSFVVLAVI